MCDKLRVGIMGGTFNPVHNGHLILAQRAYEDLHLDKVIFMPSGKSYMKKQVLDSPHRVAMLERAIAPYPYFELSLLEVERGGNTYTCDTLRELTARYPQMQFFFIMGADSLFQIESWKEPETIFALSTLVCTIRDDYDQDDIRRKAAWLQQKGADIIYLDMPQIAISSTLIRHCASHRLPLQEYVPEAVADYIEREHLYEETEEISKKTSD